MTKIKIAVITQHDMDTKKLDHVYGVNGNFKLFNWHWSSKQSDKRCLSSPPSTSLITLPFK